MVMQSWGTASLFEEEGADEEIMVSNVLTSVVHFAILSADTTSVSKYKYKAHISQKQY